MSKPLILVTAANGKTGSVVVNELLARGLPVRALVRSHDRRSKALAERGVAVVVADMFDGEQMADALKDVQRAYYCPPISPYTSMTLAAFMYAADVNRLEAAAAMTQWFACASHPTQMTRDMWAVEQVLPTLKNTAVTILNPGFFADNYLRVGIGMAAQLGLYANFVGQSKNAAPSNDDMGRVAAAVLAKPAQHQGQKYRITGPELIGVQEITAALSKVLKRKVRAIDAPLWLLNKVAAYRGEPRYDMAVFAHYLEDHRMGAAEFGGPTDVVLDVTGRPAESFETTVRTYAALPEAKKTSGAFRRVFSEFMLAPMWRGYDHEAYERQLGIPKLKHPRYTMEDEAWKAGRLAELAHDTVVPLAAMESR